VRGHEEGYPLTREPEEEVPQRPTSDRIDAGCRLFKEDHSGRVDDCARKREPLFPTAGKLGGTPIEISANPSKLDHLILAMLGLVSANAVDTRVEVDVFGDCQIFIQAELLRHIADFRLDE